jgi:hypothetical protein
VRLHRQLCAHAIGADDSDDDAQMARQLADAALIERFGG